MSSRAANEELSGPPRKSRKLENGFNTPVDKDKHSPKDAPTHHQNHRHSHESLNEGEAFSDSSDSSDLQEIPSEDILRDERSARKFDLIGDKEKDDSDVKVEQEVEEEELDNPVNGDTKNGKSKDPEKDGLLPFTMADIQEVRTFLKVEGSMAFLDKYLPATASGEDIVKLTMLLGYYPVDVADYNDEKNLVRVVKNLQKAMNKVLSMRSRLKDFNTLEKAVDKIKKSSRILVLTGAGISTSLGIPDFRSSKGFYSQLQHLGLSDPQEVFDLEFFREDPSIFYSIADMILPPENKFSPLHGFIKLLQDKGKLLRNYTQNIDNLEAAAGISPERLIQCHGSFANASCQTCRYKVPGNVIFPQIRNHELPICPRCAAKREQLEDAGRLDNAAYGVMKPDITFFGESLPSVFHDTIKKDIKSCDLLICIGTSLKVAPVSEIVNKVPENIPQILINKDPVTHCEFDVTLLGFCDQVASYLCSELHWKLDHAQMPAILDSGLKCIGIDQGSGVYEITDAKQRKAKQQQEEQERQEEAKRAASESRSDFQ